MNYLTSCPCCGAQLQPHVGPPQNAPWLCVHCHRGWWVAELATEARKAFRPPYGDFGHRPAPGRDAEVAEARRRGHSIPDHMLNLPGVAERLTQYTNRRRP